MFKKVYKSKEVTDLRDNAFKLTEVNRNRSFQTTKNRYSESDIDAYIDEQDGHVEDFVQNDDFEEEEEFYSSNSGYEEDYDDFVQDDDGYSDNSNSDYQDFGSHDFASTDWGSVDAASVDWGAF